MFYFFVFIYTIYSIHNIIYNIEHIIFAVKKKNPTDYMYTNRTKTETSLLLQSALSIYQFSIPFRPYIQSIPLVCYLLSQCRTSVYPCRCRLELALPIFVSRYYIGSNVSPNHVISTSPNRLFSFLRSFFNSKDKRSVLHIYHTPQSFFAISFMLFAWHSWSHLLRTKL